MPRPAVIQSGALPLAEASLSQAKQFFDLWFSLTPGYLIIWAKKPGSKNSLTSSFLGRTRNEDAALKAVELANSGHDVYFGTCLLAHKPGEGLRGKGEDTCATVGLWLDLDLAGDGHAGAGLCPDDASAQALVAKFGLQPSAVVHSGGGLHLYWSFSQPHKMNCFADRVTARLRSDRFQDFFRRPEVNPEAWTIDRTSDLARVLRVPGTLNFKQADPRPVQLLWVADGDTDRYSTATLEAALPALDGTPDQEAPTPTPRDWEPGTRPDAYERARLYGAAIPGESEGNRNARAFKFAADIQHGFCLPGESGYLIYQEWCDRCSPPLAKREARQAWNSARKNAQYAPGYLLSQEPTQRPFGDGGWAPPVQSGGSMVPADEPVKPSTNGSASPDPKTDQTGLFELQTAELKPEDVQGAIYRLELPIIQAGGNPPQTVIRTTLGRMKQRGRFFSNPQGLVYFNIDDPKGKIQPLNSKGLALQLGEIANFVNVKGRDKETDLLVVGCRSFPGPLAEQMLEMSQTELGLPELTRVVPVPVFASNGQLLQKTGVYPDHSIAIQLGVKVPSVSDCPSMQEVTRARELFEEMVFDFPFSGRADRANACALWLSVYIRELTGLCPFMVAEAPCPGTGKGLLVDLLLGCFVGFGSDRQGIAMIGEFDRGEGPEKVLCATLLAGPSVVQIDNFVKLASGQFCFVLTTLRPSFRYLGESRMVTPWNLAVWVGTANNPVYSDEIARRVVPIRIASPLERPSERTHFRHPDVMQWATDNRPKLVWAALTLVQNWVAKGMPKGGQVFGSFQRWADVLGGILACAGIEGFLEGRAESLARSDVESQEWSAFFGAWYSKFGQGKVTTSELVQVVRETTTPSHVFRCSTDQSQLTTLGRALHGRMHRVYAGLRLDSAGASNGRQRYALSVVAEAHPPSVAEEIQAGLEAADGKLF